MIKLAFGPVRQGFTSTDLWLALMTLVWGVNFIVIKDALVQVSPSAFNAVRFALAATTIGTIAWLRGVRVPAAADLKRLAMLGVLGNSIYQVAFIEGVARTRAGNAALIMASVPVQTAIISHLRGHQRLRQRDGLGLALSSLGIAVIVLGSGRAVGFGGTMLGDLLVLAAAVCWAAYTVLSKPTVDRLGAIATTAWTMLIGCLPLLLVSTPALLGQDWSRFTPRVWGALVFSAMGALVFAYFVWYRGVQRLGPSQTAMYSNFIPVVAMLAAWAMLGETPTAWQLLGASGIFGGIYLTRT